MPGIKSPVDIRFQDNNLKRLQAVGLIEQKQFNPRRMTAEDRKIYAILLKLRTNWVGKSGVCRVCVSQRKAP